MAIKVATLAVDITVAGVAKAIAGLSQVNERVSAVRKAVLGTAAGLLKLWAAWQFVTSASSIASAVMDVFTSAFGYLINVILLPFLPLLMGVGLELYKFGNWFSQQGPAVRAELLLLGGALLVAFGGPMAASIGVVIIALGLMYAWASTKSAFIVGALLLIGAALIPLDVPALAFLAAIMAIVGAVLLLRAAFLALTGQGWQMPSLDSIKASIGLSPSGVPSLPPSAVGGMPSGSTYNTQNWNVNIAGGSGGAPGGRDAAIAFNSHVAAAQRMF